MASSASRSILWFDAHIALDLQCKGLKLMFQTDLTPIAQTSVDPIDDMICCIRQHAAPISFASNIPGALELIETHTQEGKQITIITSASLGKDLIPEILRRKFIIESYYIFCGNMAENKGWASDYLDDGLDIQMFDFETNLLICLERDFSAKLIKEGKNHLGSNPQSALHYFRSARSLVENAVLRDTPTDPNDRYRPSTSHRQILDGENGLIAQAERACAWAWSCIHTHSNVLT